MNDYISTERDALLKGIKESGSLSVRLGAHDKYSSLNSSYIKLEKIFANQFSISIPNPEKRDEDEWQSYFVNLSRKELIKLRNIINLSLDDSFISVNDNQEGA